MRGDCLPDQGLRLCERALHAEPGRDGHHIAFRAYVLDAKHCRLATTRLSKAPVVATYHSAAIVGSAGPAPTENKPS